MVDEDQEDISRILMDQIYMVHANILLNYFIIQIKIRIRKYFLTD